MVSVGVSIITTSIASNVWSAMGAMWSGFEAISPFLLMIELYFIHDSWIYLRDTAQVAGTTVTAIIGLFVQRKVAAAQSRTPVTLAPGEFVI